MKILSDRIVWDEEDWLGGLVPQARLNAPISMGAGAAYQRNVNPFRRIGAIAPGLEPVSVTNIASITSVVGAGDVDYSGTVPYAYLVGGALVHRLKLDDDTISVAAPWPHTIVHHANVVAQDLKVYNITNAVTSTSSTMALYSFYDGTDGDVGAFDISSALPVFYDNFLSTQPIGGSVLTTDPHPMILGDDGVLYIGNGRTLLALDGEASGGSGGTLTTVLTLPRGTIIRSFTKYNDYLMIFTSRSNTVSGSYYRGTATAYLWNYLSQNFNFSYDLTDNLVTVGFNWLGIPGCFTYGRAAEGNGALSSKLKLFNGTKFEQVLEFPTAPPGHGGVEIHDGMIIWNCGDTTSHFIGSYGSPWGTRVNNSFNFWGEQGGDDLTLATTGMCANLGGSKLYVSSGNGDPGGLETLSGGFGPMSATASYFQGMTARLNFPFQTRGKIKSVKIHFRGVATAGRTLELRLYADKVATYSIVFTGLGTFTDTTKEYFCDSSNKEFPYFHAIWPLLMWDTGTNSTDCPVVTKVEVFFESVKFTQ